MTNSVLCMSCRYPSAQTIGVQRALGAYPAGTRCRGCGRVFEPLAAEPNRDGDVIPMGRWRRPTAVEELEDAVRRL